MTEDWRGMTKEERMALPLGHPGWKHTPGGWLPKGIWIEEHPEPVVFPNGAVCTKVKWCSNGIGAPSMDLVGSTKNVDASKIEFKDGWYPMPPGAYFPFKPAKGDPDFGGDKPYKRGK